MKTRRANISGRVSAIWKSESRLRSHELQCGKSGIAVLAVLSVIALFTSVMWQSNQTIQATNSYSGSVPSEQVTDAMTGADALAQLRARTLPASPATATSSTFSDIGAGIISQLLGTFTTLQQSGSYTPQMGEKVAEGIGNNVRPSVPSVTYDDTSVRTDPDTSPARALAYRSDLQIALKPLLLNDEAEYAVFGRYQETGDKNQLVKLQQYASNYRAAASNAATLIVPTDAVAYHVALLNSLQQFAATLDAQVTHAGDPFASAALLVTYNSAETQVRTSFAGLVSYFKQKLL